MWMNHPKNLNCDSVRYMWGFWLVDSSVFDMAIHLYHIEMRLEEGPMFLHLMLLGVSIAKRKEVSSLCRMDSIHTSSYKLCKMY